MDANYIIERLGLMPVPEEGGYYRETYRSAEKIPHGALPAHYTAERDFSSAIYYLITADSFSALHRLKTDEIFHFYLGDPVLMLKLHPDGRGETITLGNDLAEGHQPQCIVTGGTWQGMKLLDGGRFALMGTTMAPAFDFRDFEKGKRSVLIEKYPGYAQLIESLTIA